MTHQGYTQCILIFHIHHNQTNVKYEVTYQGHNI